MGKVCSEVWKTLLLHWSWPWLVPRSERTSDPEEYSVLGFLTLCLSTLDAVQLSAWILCSTLVWWGHHFHPPDGAPAFPPVCLSVCLTASQNHFNLHSCLTRALGNDIYFKSQLLPLRQGPFWSLPFYTLLFNRCPLDLWLSNFEEWPVRYLWTSKHTESLRL